MATWQVARHKQWHALQSHTGYVWKIIQKKHCRWQEHYREFMYYVVDDNDEINSGTFIRSESFRFCLENYSNNEAVTSSTVITVTQAWVWKFLKTNMSWRKSGPCSQWLWQHYQRHAHQSHSGLVWKITTVMATWPVARHKQWHALQSHTGYAWKIIQKKHCRWQEHYWEIMYHLVDDNDEINSGTFIRVIQVLFGKLQQ